MSTRAATREPDLAPEVAARTKGLRTGWTTGACASAAAKAGAVGLVTGTAPTEVDVGLPSGRRVSFPVESEVPNRCVVVKDAGDDPDCTDGARVTAEVAWAKAGARSTDLRGRRAGDQSDRGRFGGCARARARGPPGAQALRARRDLGREVGLPRCPTRAHAGLPTVDSDRDRRRNICANWGA